jgi:hypothetical protein
MEKLGPENVVCVITDNASNCKVGTWAWAWRSS